MGSIRSPCTVSTQNQGAEFRHGGEGGSTALTPVPWQAGTGGPASGDVSPGGNSCTPRTSARPQVRTERAGGRCCASTPGQASALLVSVRGDRAGRRGDSACVQSHGGGVQGEVSRARGGELCERRLPPRGGCRGGPCSLFLFMKNSSFLTKARGSAASRAFWMGAGIAVGPMGVSRLGCAFVPQHCSGRGRFQPSIQGSQLGSAGTIPLVRYPPSFAPANAPY